MTKTHTRAPLALCLAFVACKGKAAPPPPVGPSIEVFTDQTARSVTVDRAFALTTIVTPPPTSWIAVSADTADDRSIEFASPATTYAGDEIRLYLDHGKVAIGVFPPVTADMPPQTRERASQPILSLVGITSVHVATHLPTLPALTISVDGHDVTLASDALRSVPTEDSFHAQGWPLTAILALANAPSAKSVRVVGAQEITLDAQEIAKALIKPNQRGEYVVRVWDEGAKTPTREVRGVTKIVVGGS